MIKDNEVLFIYNSNDMQERRALGYAKSLKNHKLKEKDLYKENLSETQIKEIANKIGEHPISLINKNSDLYKEEYNGLNYDEEDILKLIKNNPLIMKTPIAVYHDRASFVESSFEFIKMDMVSHSFKDELSNKDESGTDKTKI